MVTKVDPVDLGEIVTAGDDYNLEITLTKDGAVYDVTDAVITASIRAVGGTVDLIADHTVIMTTPIDGIINLILTDIETLLLDQPSASGHLQTIQHISDVKVVESGGGVLHCGPFTFDVRRALT